MQLKQLIALLAIGLPLVSAAPAANMKHEAIHPNPKHGEEAEVIPFYEKRAEDSEAIPFYPKRAEDSEAIPFCPKRAEEEAETVSSYPYKS
ncbi:hypothetical protein AJ80_09370 [Polytolypa hystricis UAMH7299]|uniref:Uncharacterized protein n=1 Tax=Polytolypa hystricis (strain UAMH7299) TaxID=1447883 RepID=A0A2B7WRV4_POLH7|nr:hypothetical protein AJ80_09370 [Polytolypa hystricis UAMH7299]